MADDTVQKISEQVTEPEYYEVADGVMHWDYGQWLPYLIGCATKYLERAGRKPGESALKDLIKARNYLRKEVQRVEIIIAGISNRISADNSREEHHLQEEGSGSHPPTP